MLSQLRQFSIYNAENHDTPTFLVGAGATGSAFALQFAKLGNTKLSICDPDKIEDHNLTNQLYGPKHVGQFKAQVCAKIVNSLTDTAPIIYVMPAETLLSTVEANTVVFAVDTMKTRKNLFETALAGKSLLIDMRISPRYIHVLTINLLRKQERDYYEMTLFSDDDVALNNRAPCGTAISIGATAQLAANLAIWNYIDYCNDLIKIGSETCFSLESWSCNRTQLGVS